LMGRANSRLMMFLLSKAVKKKPDMSFWFIKGGSVCYLTSMKVIGWLSGGKG
jgi:hypothetical protein